MTKKLAIILVVLGALLMSLNGILIKLIEDADGFQILFYRSLTLSLTVGLVISIKRNERFLNFIKSFDKWDSLLGIFLSVAFIFYVFSIILSSVAATLFILASSPLIAALLSWLILKEVTNKITYFAMLLSTIGVAIMVKESFETSKAIGNFLALLSACAFASMLVTARKSGKADVLNGTFIGGVLSGVFGLFFLIVSDTGLYVGFQDLVLMFVMGSVAIGLGISLVTWAAPFVPAPEVAVLVLLESLLGPLWVWILLKDGMTFYELLGGLLIFLAVIILSYASSKEPA